MTHALAHKSSHISTMYYAIEAAGYLWTAEAEFHEKILSDKLLVKIHFQNVEGSIRLLDLTLSKAGFCEDPHGDYRERVAACIQGWLWSERQRGQISYMGA
jgi:hypothetical protein